MAVFSGCQEGKQTPKLVEVICPVCGEIIELFVRQDSAEDTGRTRGEAVCEKCGYKVEEGTALSDFKLA